MTDNKKGHPDEGSPKQNERCNPTKIADRLRGWQVLACMLTFSAGAAGTQLLIVLAVLAVVALS